MTQWRAWQRMHPSWLIAIACLGVCLGVMMATSLVSYAYAAAWMLLLGLVALVADWKRKRCTVPLFLITGICIGLLRGADYVQSIAPLQSIVGEVMTVQGVVSEDIDTGKRGETVLRLRNIVVNERSLGGNMWISMSTKATIKRGDVVAVKGKVSDGFGSFAASMYRAELLSVERPIPGDIALRVRDWFADGVRRAIPEPEASLGVGYIVGQRRSLPEQLDAALRTVGLTHVVVASGYNLTILVNVARRLFARISKFQALFFSSGLTLSFIAITGMSPSMSRAGLVTGLGLLAWYYGRRFHPFVLLLLAAALTLLWQPAYARGDLGWQLSFTSFAGVLIVAPLLQRYFFGEARPGVLRQVFFETLSAWVCTVPLIVLAFGQFSNVAILANLLVLPLIPLAMLLTFIAGGGAILVPAVAFLVGLPAAFLLGYMTRVAIFLGDLPWAQTIVEIPQGGVAVYYLLLVLFCAYIWRKTDFSFMKRAVD